MKCGKHIAGNQDLSGYIVADGRLGRGREEDLGVGGASAGNHKKQTEKQLLKT
jgi:hypothetical protein